MWYSLVMKPTCSAFSPVNVNIPICFIIWLQSPGVPNFQFYTISFSLHIHRSFLSINYKILAKPLAFKASKSCCLMLIILSAIAFSSTLHSWYILLFSIWIYQKTVPENIEFEPKLFGKKRSGVYLSLSMVATMDAPWMGGLEYIGLITNLSWLSTLDATSADLRTCNHSDAN